MILQVIILLAGFAMLVKGADWFVEGAAGIAKKLGIPQQAARLHPRIVSVILPAWFLLPQAVRFLLSGLHFAFHTLPSLLSAAFLRHGSAPHPV